MTGDIISMSKQLRLHPLKSGKVGSLPSKRRFTSNKGSFSCELYLVAWLTIKPAEYLMGAYSTHADDKNVPNEGSFSHKKGDTLNLSWNSDDVRALDL